MHNSLECFQKYIDNNNIDKEIQCTFNQPACKQNLNRSSVHKIQPGRGQGDADQIFDQCTADGTDFVHPCLIENQSTQEAYQRIAEGESRKISESPYQAVQHIA